MTVAIKDGDQGLRCLHSFNCNIHYVVIHYVIVTFTEKMVVIPSAHCMATPSKNEFVRHKKTGKWYIVSELGGDLIGICPVFEGAPATTGPRRGGGGGGRPTPVATPVTTPAATPCASVISMYKYNFYIYI